jgi:hypothetical protein
MSSPVARLVLFTAAFAAAWELSAAPPGALVPIPLHELNYSPSFSGYSGDKTLVRGKQPATVRSEIRSPTVTTTEMDPLHLKLESLKTRLLELQQERDLLLLKKLAPNVTVTPPAAPSPASIKTFAAPKARSTTPKSAPAKSPPATPAPKRS